VDAFINTSRTEGGAPVSIVEAISHGIPVIATAAGGNVDIVSGRNGILLAEHPAVEQIAGAIAGLSDDPGSAAALRLGSRSVWSEGFDASKNHRRLAELMHEVRAA
jgi:glycosyltransferase involved in cell wall biosynthesis